MLALLVYLSSVAFFWISAVVFYNTKTTNKKPDGGDFIIMLIPTLNVFVGIIMWIDILRLNKNGFAKIFFLNFRNKGKR
jgi:hypothetical protein